MEIPQNVQEVLRLTNPNWLRYIQECSDVSQLSEVRMMPGTDDIEFDHSSKTSIQDDKDEEEGVLDIARVEYCLVGELHNSKTGYLQECGICHQLSLDFNNIVRQTSDTKESEFRKKLNQFASHIKECHQEKMRQRQELQSPTITTIKHT